MPAGFFENAADDAALEQDNAAFWTALVDRITSDSPDARITTVLDIGCHLGGLLARLARVWKLRAVYGLEPLADARARAATRLHGAAEHVSILAADGWSEIPRETVDLVTGHEVLYLVDDLSGLMECVATRLAKGGRAYFVLGCHAENPVWPDWKAKLEAMGHRTYDHRPLDILNAAGRSGLTPSVRPLRDNGWVDYNPLRADFAFPTVSTLLDHHFRQKLLFRFTKP